ncbi:MAG: hypothetical protein CVV44_07740 [Spirochaetae bacterium HGW-Spirochaetae-1]|jgi:hypothetical protein|nr:MAG: hypothetical protein CVV44_07740 [Spirochaetae bacterium HGW-Spirochaetae-1]
MNWKRLIISTLAVFLAFQAMDYFIHNVILMSAYEATTKLWRPEMMDLMWIMILTGIFLSFMFVFIFVKGYEGRGLAEGLRYGLVIGLFMNVPAAFNQYVVYPLPFSLSMQWLVYGMAEFIVAGVIVAAVYRPVNA